MQSLPSTAGLRSRVDQAIGKRDSVQSRLTGTVASIKQLENEVTLADLVAELLRKLIDQEVTIGVKAVEKLQTEGLQAVFDDQDLSVRSDVDVQRGKVAVDLVTIQKYPNGTEIEGVSNDSFGGSVSTVQSVLLRMIIVLRRGLRPFLLLDESLAAFDSNYVHNMCRFMSLLCKRLDFHILLVTHNPAVVEAADRAFRIVRKNGTARFERIVKPKVLEASP